MKTIHLVDAQSGATICRFPIDAALWRRLRVAAAQLGVSPEFLFLRAMDEMLAA